MFRPDRVGLIGCALIFVLSFVLQGKEEGRDNYNDDHVSKRRPPPAAMLEERRRPNSMRPNPILPAISKNDPSFPLAPSTKGNSTGTAFSIGAGLWMTARHVVEGCRKYGIVVGVKRVEKGFDLIMNPYHDLAIFKTKRNAPAFGFENESLRIGQSAFHFGYPQGKPAAIHSTLLGRMKINPGRKTRHKEPVIAWSELRRAPNFPGSLGGISGGPVVDKDGDIIGVSVVESRRRGRVFTSAPEGMRDMLSRSNEINKWKNNDGLEVSIDANQFPEVGKGLRERLSVSKVLCWAN